jgi:lipid II:glycine glycyltransferase (peptidoglycan interpeptide bridge formation enzyme)
MQRLKATPLPLSFFKYLWSIFEPTGEMKIFLCEYNNKAIAGVLRFIHKRVMYSWGAAFLREYAYQRPLDLLVWHTIKWSVDNGIYLLDLGSTPNNPSSTHYIFKKSWGGEKKILYNYHIILQPNKMKLYRLGNKLANEIKNIFP